MLKNPIDKLEELVPRLVDEARQLREANQRLRKELKSSCADLERSQKDELKLQNKVKRLAELESAQKKMEKDHTKIRSTVENLLTGIDKISLSL